VKGTKSTLNALHGSKPEIRTTEPQGGKLKPRPEHYSVNTKTKSDRVMTQIVLTPDSRFLMATLLFDKHPGMKPDGRPDLAVSNMKDKDGLVIFPVKGNGELGKPRFIDAGGAAASLRYSCTTARTPLSPAMLLAMA